MSVGKERRSKLDAHTYGNKITEMDLTLYFKNIQAGSAGIAFLEAPRVLRDIVCRSEVCCLQAVVRTRIPLRV